MYQLKNKRKTFVKKKRRHHPFQIFQLALILPMTKINLLMK
jgi:hypothetical protein